jgi:hypothetical protein
LGAADGGLPGAWWQACYGGGALGTAAARAASARRARARGRRAGGTRVAGGEGGRVAGGEAGRGVGGGVSEREKKEKPSVWLSSPSLPSARDAALGKDFFLFLKYALPSARSATLGKGAFFAECHPGALGKD